METLTKLQKEESELKARLEKIQNNITKEKEKNTPKPNHETITTLEKVYNHLKCDSKKDVIKIDKFTKEETAVVEGVIERLRICKALNDGQLPAKNERWCPWFYRKNTKDNNPNSAGAGLVFHYSGYVGADADLGSAARLSFLDSARSNAYAKNFIKTEEKIIQL